MPNHFSTVDRGSDLDKPIVNAALDLYRREPFKEPLQILDATIGHRAGYQLDYEFEEDELRPPHPFAELLQRAFAPAIGSLSLTPEQQWTHIILPFARRYRIWEPDADHATSDDGLNYVTSIRTRGNSTRHPV